MSWKEKRLITILSIILSVLCAAVLLVLSVRYRAAQAAKAEGDQTSASDIAQAAQSDYIARSGPPGRCPTPRSGYPPLWRPGPPGTARSAPAARRRTAPPE